MSPVHVFQPRDKSSQARSSPHQSPFPDSTLDLLQRALQTHEDGKLKPDAVIALQSAYGNHFVRSLLERKHPEEQPETRATGTSDVQANQLGPTLSQQVTDGRRSGDTLQRIVPGRFFRNNPKDPLDETRVVARFAAEHAQAYQTAMKLGMQEGDLIAICRPYVASPDIYTLEGVFSVVKQLIQERQERGSGASPSVKGGNVEFHVQTTTASIPAGLEMDVDQGAGKYSTQTHVIEFGASVLARGPASEIDEWEVGFIQTVTSSETTAKYVDAHDKINIWKRWIPGPRRDGPKGYPGPWYDPRSHVSFQKEWRGFDKDLGTTSIGMKDQPGWSFQLHTPSRVLSAYGRDEYRTWLIARKKDGNAIRYIRMWNWHVDFAFGENASNLGARLDGIAPSPTGEGAVLDGNIPQDDWQTEYRVLPKELTMSFDQLRQPRY